MLCYNTIFSGYQCTHQYEPWFEFYPLGTVYDPFFWVSTTDTLVSDVFLSGFVFYAGVFDQNTGQGFMGIHINLYFIGSVNWAQFQAESAKAFFGGYYATPVFDFWYNPIQAPSYPANLQPYGANSNSIFTPGPIDYNSNACSGTGESCFQVQT
jgi:hypothetical protein